MTSTTASTLCAAGALVATCMVTAPAVIGATAVVRGAEVSIVVTSPTACEVTIALTVDGAADIDHRVQSADGARIELVETQGARLVSDVRRIGRTQSLVLRPELASYEIRYRVRQPDDLPNRCPIWLPALPTDGRSRVVGIRVQLPAGATPGHSMPALEWTGTHGSVRLAHLPAFAHLPYASPGDPPGWSIGQVMDAIAILAFGAATAVWALRRTR